MALSLDEIKRKKVNIVKKKNEDTTISNEVRQKVPPFRIDDTTRTDKSLIEMEKSDSLSNSVKASPLNDHNGAGDSMDVFKTKDFRDSINTKQQTSNKLVTNITETSNSAIDKLVTNSIETSNKLVTFSESKPNIEEIGQQTSNKLVTNIIETSNTTNNKTSNKNDNNVTSLKKQKNDQTYASQSGLKRQIIYYIYERCFKNINSIKTNNSGPITKEQLADYTGKNANVIHVYLHRLLNENLIIKVSSKEGRGGYTIFTLPQSIYQEIMYNHSNETSNKLVTQLVTQLVTPASSKLVSNYNNTNYLSEENQNSSVTSSEVDTKSAQNSGWFKNLDFSNLPGIKPLMVNSAIRDLVQSKLDPDDVQMFINKFKNWLSMQVKIKNPLAIFCDKLKEFANEGDSPILEVMSDDEIQIELKMAQEIEKKRAEMELINKARSFKIEQENEARFEEWLSAASDEDKKALQPESSIAPFGSKIYLITLKEAFLNQVNQNRGAEL